MYRFIPNASLSRPKSEADFRRVKQARRSIFFYYILVDYLFQQVLETSEDGGGILIILLYNFACQFSVNLDHMYISSRDYSWRCHLFTFYCISRINTQLMLSSFHFILYTFFVINQNHQKKFGFNVMSTPISFYRTYQVKLLNIACP